ncbi:glycosyltransferase family 2 protein [Siccibacter colletis]|uniref:glycosyltransferase family 2 protein n=1 Tax=Siccibacter colletis TaxID=1505757 RepID=UPI0004E1D6F0|nr:glycosyltransferase [Siccibacter colletis]
MNNEVLVSVIIPTYKRADGLEKAIQSVLTQTYKNLQIIIVNDNDDESYIEKVHFIKNKFHDVRIKYFSDKVNRGGAGARNLGIDIADGDYITFLDDDDIYLPNKIEKQIEHLVKENIDVSVCDMFFLKNEKFILNNSCFANASTLAEFIIRGNCFTPMILTTAKVLKSVNGFTKISRYQDHVLMLKLLAAGFKVARLPEQLFIHNFHDGERITFSNNSIEAYRLRQQIEQRYYHILNPCQKKEYTFKNSLMDCKIQRYENNYLSTLKFLYQALRSVSGANDLISFFKCLVRVTFFGKKNL